MARYQITKFIYPIIKCTILIASLSLLSPVVAKNQSSCGKISHKLAALSSYTKHAAKKIVKNHQRFYEVIGKKDTEMIYNMMTKKQLYMHSDGTFLLGSGAKATTKSYSLEMAGYMLAGNRKMGKSNTEEGHKLWHLLNELSEGTSVPLTPSLRAYQHNYGIFARQNDHNTGLLFTITNRADQAFKRIAALVNLKPEIKEISFSIDRQGWVRIFNQQNITHSTLKHTEQIDPKMFTTILSKH